MHMHTHEGRQVQIQLHTGLSFDLTVAKLLKRTPKDEKSFCFGCNAEDYSYIELIPLLRMRTGVLDVVHVQCGQLVKFVSMHT